MGQSLRLFEQFVRTDHRHAYRSEPDYEFLNRSAWPACENIREGARALVRRLPCQSQR